MSPVPAHFAADLPPLPEGAPTFTTEQMLEYGRACAASDWASMYYAQCAATDEWIEKYCMEAGRKGALEVQLEQMGGRLLSAISQARVLRSTLANLLKHFPTDSDMHEAGWTDDEVNSACYACYAARAVIARADGVPT